MEEQTSQLVQTAKISKVNTLVLVFISVLLTAVTVGTTVFVWQKSVVDKTLKKQISDLEKERNDVINQKEAAERKVCKGFWKDGACVKFACVDSDVNEKPDDKYIKGNVSYTDEDGVESTVYDECSGSKQQVNEKWCYESPVGSGNYVQGSMVYDCPKGCLDGACVK